MEIAVPTLIVGVVLGILPVVLGVIIGAWMTHGKMAAEKARRDEAAHAQQMIAGLLQWAHAVKGDVSQYSVHMADLSRQLQPSAEGSCGDDAAAAEPASGNVLTQIELSNQQLQERLDAAETALEQQTGQLGEYLSQARTDPLTGLPNRRAFDDEISRRLAEFDRKGTPLSVIFVDIDQFKRLNDQYGHLAGDEVIKTVTQSLNACLRDIDMVARIGGEEFALLLPDTRAPNALLPTERARLAVAAATTDYEDQEIRATISCGVAELQPADDAAAVLRRADEALYASKTAGRNCTHLHNGVTREYVDLDSLLPVGPPKQRTSAQPTGLIPEQFTDVCQDLRQRLFQHLQ